MIGGSWGCGKVHVVKIDLELSGINVERRGVIGSG